jgi:hypothetical protein
MISWQNFPYHEKAPCEEQGRIVRNGAIIEFFQAAPVFHASAPEQGIWRRLMILSFW